MVGKRPMRVGRNFQSHFFLKHFCHKKQNILFGTIPGTGEMVHLLSACSTNMETPAWSLALAQPRNSTVARKRQANSWSLRTSKSLDELVSLRLGERPSLT